MIVNSQGFFEKEDGCVCWICKYIDQVNTAQYTTKTEVLAEHPPTEVVQRETTEERNERIWQAIKDAAGG